MDQIYNKGGRRIYVDSGCEIDASKVSFYIFFFLLHVAAFPPNKASAPPAPTLSLPFHWWCILTLDTFLPNDPSGSRLLQFRGPRLSCIGTPIGYFPSISYVQ